MGQWIRGPDYSNDCWLDGENSLKVFEMEIFIRWLQQQNDNMFINLFLYLLGLRVNVLIIVSLQINHVLGLC